ncbi:NB-ARC domain-containing protein [Streptomyces sp. NPDC058308]|uniref:NB-ARC domain-containing protein n=1 Tax=Streptomyces sp. NPDC058308 TaxID=3346440 RepID=UPI0036E6A3D2
MRTKAWVWTAAVVAGTTLSAALALLLALAGAPATAAPRWPGYLDELRQHPWAYTVVLGALGIAAAGVMAWLQSRPPAVANDPPPPSAPTLPEWFIDRAEAHATVTAVCRGDRAVGLTTALAGAGGFGKTMLAEAVCANGQVRRRFRSRIYLVTIGRDVRGRADVTAKVAEVTRFVTGDTTEFDDPALAGSHLGRLLDQRPRTLLVLDDVWEHEQLAPFLRGGRRCVRLITTRKPELVPAEARIPVDQMSRAQAQAVLTWHLPPLPGPLVDALLQATGRWALLLRLTNRLIAEQHATGADAASAGERILHRLRGSGPAAVDSPTAAWDLDDPGLRNQRVRASIEAATTLLPADSRQRLAELGIFAAGESLPLSVVTLLWQGTGGLDEEQCRTLCRDLERLSLLTLDQSDGGWISLHDVIHDYLRGELGADGLVRVNYALTGAIATNLPTARPLAPDQVAPGHAWWQLTDDYLLDHLIVHLLAAGRTSQAEAVAGDIRWVETRLSHRGPTAPWSDLVRTDTPHTRLLAHTLSQAAHLLSPTDPPHLLTGVLHTLLDTHTYWRPQVAARRNDLAQRPCLEPLWPLPDAPASALRRTLTGHVAGVWAVAVAPDGTWLATSDGRVRVWEGDDSGDDGTVRIWDRASGTCTATLTGHRGRVGSIAISPDGTWLATTGGSDYAFEGDGTVRIWDRASGTCTATLTGNDSNVKSVVVAPDGTWLATTGHDDEAVWIWDPSTGVCTATLTGRAGAVRSMAIAPDGRWLATISFRDGAVRIWDRATGTCTATLTAQAGWLGSVQIAPDGRWLATTCAADKAVQLWDVATGTCTTTVPDQPHRVRAMAIAPDSTWLATVDGHGSVRIWDRASGTCTATLTGHRGRVASIAIAPDSTWLATGGEADGTVRIWDRAAGSCTATLTGHRGSVGSIAIAPDGAWLAAGSDGDKSVRIWDRSLAVQTPPDSVHRNGVAAVAISPDGTWLATGDGDDYGDGKARIWDRATGTCTATLTGHRRRVAAVAISPDGTWLATGDGLGKVRIWDRASGACTATLTGNGSEVKALAIAPDGTWLAAGGELDEALRIWDLATATCKSTFEGHYRTVESVAIAPDGTWLATSDNLGDVRIWDRTTGTCTAAATDREFHSVDTLAISPDSTWLAAAGGRYDGYDDGIVRIGDRASGTWTHTLTGHRGRVGAIAISPDGMWLASVGGSKYGDGGDGTLRIWNTTTRSLAAVARAESALFSCAWGPEHVLAVGGRRGLYLFQLRV